MGVLVMSNGHDYELHECEIETKLTLIQVLIKLIYLLVRKKY